MSLTLRAATVADAAAIARIYNEGIEERVATFETRLRETSDIQRWLDGRHPVLVAERDGVIVGFAATFEYRPRECYAGIAETSLYVARAAPDSGSSSRACSRRTPRASRCSIAPSSAASDATRSTRASTASGAM